MLLQSLGHHAVHVLDVELARVNDLEIWEYAAQHGYTIVSKDADFADLALLAQTKVRVIWVRIAVILRGYEQFSRNTKSGREAGIKGGCRALAMA